MEEELIRALISIYRYCHGTQSPRQDDFVYLTDSMESLLDQLPGGLHIMEFGTALEVVRVSDIDHAVRRRIYVAAKLAGAGNFAAASKVWGREIDICDGTRFDVESEVAESLFRATALTCRVINRHSVKIDIDDTWISAATFDVNVNVPFAALVAKIDPQSWDDCNPYFAKAWTIDDPRDVRQNYDVPASTTPPGAGSTWCKYFFEEFNVAGVSWFKTVLHIETERRKDEFDMSFSLLNCKRSRILISTMTGGIDVDSGRSIASADGADSTRCIGKKKIRFERRGTRPLDGVFFKMLNIWCALVLHTSTDEGLQVSLCC